MHYCWGICSKRFKLNREPTVSQVNERFSQLPCLGLSKEEDWHACNAWDLTAATSDQNELQFPINKRKKEYVSKTNEQNQANEIATSKQKNEQEDPSDIDRRKD